MLSSKRDTLLNSNSNGSASLIPIFLMVFVITDAPTRASKRLSGSFDGQQQSKQPRTMSEETEGRRSKDACHNSDNFYENGVLFSE